jgi:DNA-binding PadR family transcriptional regulator
LFAFLFSPFTNKYFSCHFYRRLRDLEENGLVASEWETDGTEPAKRVYQLTTEGGEVLDYWIVYMKEQAEKLPGFIERYENI